MMKAFLQFQQECKKQGYEPPSYYTFTKNVKKTPKYDQVKSRKGSKAAYASGEFFYELWQESPRHGDRIFEICHSYRIRYRTKVYCNGEKSRETLGNIFSRCFFKKVIIYLYFF